MYGPRLSSSLLSENGSLKQLREDNQPSERNHERNHVLPRAGSSVASRTLLEPFIEFSVPPRIPNSRAGAARLRKPAGPVFSIAAIARLGIRRR
jgi:hypothetical protein